VPSWVLRFSGFGVLGLNSLWVLLGSFVGCSQVLLLGFRVLLNAFCGLNLVVLVYTQFFLLIKKKSLWTDVACARVMRNLWTTFFFTVMWAYALWNNIFTRFSMSWVMPRRVINLFACWWKSRRPRSAAIWKMVSIYIF
jgi:hypothetical protein